MRILICGDRNWDDVDSVERVVDALINKYGGDISIIQGAASGADSIAGDVALKKELVCVSVPAKWSKHNKAAGPIRNEYMLYRCKPNFVVAFHEDLANSRGTKHMVALARKENIFVICVRNYQEALFFKDKLVNENDDLICQNRVTGKSRL